MEMSTDITPIRELQSQLTSIGLLVGSISHGIKGLVTEGIRQAIEKHSDIDEVVEAVTVVLGANCIELDDAEGSGTKVILESGAFDSLEDLFYS